MPVDGNAEAEHNGYLTVLDTANSGSSFPFAGKAAAAAAAELGSDDHRTQQKHQAPEHLTPTEANAGILMQSAQRTSQRLPAATTSASSANIQHAFVADSFASSSFIEQSTGSNIIAEKLQTAVALPTITRDQAASMMASATTSSPQPQPTHTSSTNTATTVTPTTTTTTAMSIADSLNMQNTSAAAPEELPAVSSTAHPEQIGSSSGMCTNVAMPIVTPSSEAQTLSQQMETAAAAAVAEHFSGQNLQQNPTPQILSTNAAEQALGMNMLAFPTEQIPATMLQPLGVQLPLMSPIGGTMPQSATAEMFLGSSGTLEGFQHIQSQQQQQKKELSRNASTLQQNAQASQSHNRSASVADGLLAMYPSDGSNGQTPRSGIIVSPLPNDTASAITSQLQQAQLRLQLQQLQHQQQQQQQQDQINAALKQGQQLKVSQPLTLLTQQQAHQEQSLQLQLQQHASSNVSTAVSANPSGIPSPFPNFSAALGGPIPGGHRRQLSSTFPATIRQNMLTIETPATMATAPPTLVPGTPTSFGQLPFLPQARGSATAPHRVAHHSVPHLGHSRHLSLDAANFRLMAAADMSSFPAMHPFQETIHEHPSEIAQALTVDTGVSLSLEQQQQLQCAQVHTNALMVHTVPATPQHPTALSSFTIMPQPISVSDSTAQRQQMLVSHISPSVDMASLSSAFAGAPATETRIPAVPAQLALPDMGGADMVDINDLEDYDSDEDDEELGSASDPMPGAGDEADKDGPGKVAADASGKANGGKAVKRKKSKAPYKRFRNSFLMFVSFRRSELMRSLPKGTKMQNTGFVSRQSKIWNDMTDEAKAPFVEMAEKDKIRYEADVKKYGSLDNYKIPSEPESSTSATDASSTNTTAAAAASRSKAKGKSKKKGSNAALSMTPIAPAPAPASAPKTASQPAAAAAAPLNMPPAVAAKPLVISTGAVNSQPLAIAPANASTPTLIASSALGAAAAEALNATTTSSTLAAQIARPLTASAPCVFSSAGTSNLGQHAIALQGYPQAFGQVLSVQPVDFDTSCFINYEPNELPGCPSSGPTKQSTGGAGKPFVSTSVGIKRKCSSDGLSLAVLPTTAKCTAMSEEEKAQCQRIAGANMDGLSTQEGKQEALHPDESPEKKAKKSRRHSSTRANIPGSVGSNGEQTAQLQLHQQPSSATAAELTQNLLISIAHSGLNISLASTSGAVYSPAANCTGEDAACETSIHSTFVGTPTLTTFNTPIATPLLTPNIALEKADPRSATGHLPGLPSVPEEMACSAELVVEAIVADSAAPVSLSPAPTAQTSASGDSGSAVVTAVPSEEMHKS